MDSVAGRLCSPVRWAEPLFKGPAPRMHGAIQTILHLFSEELEIDFLGAIARNEGEADVFYLLYLCFAQFPVPTPTAPPRLQRWSTAASFTGQQPRVHPYCRAAEFSTLRAPGPVVGLGELAGWGMLSVRSA